MSISALYQLENKEYLRLLKEGTDYTGELNNIAILEEIDDTIENKIINMAKVKQTIESDIKTIDVELDRIKQLKKVAEHNKDIIKDYMVFSFLTLDKKVIETPTMKITLRNNPFKLVIDDERKLPDTYKKVDIHYIIDKESIKKDLENGLEIEGCFLERGQSVIVR
jgi:hypothetical protein